MTIDLTTLTEPFCNYDAETKGRLLEAFWAGGVIECAYPCYDFVEDAVPSWEPNEVYRLRPKPLRDMVVSPELWRMLHPKWRWAARDEDGRIVAYDLMPEPKKISWHPPEGGYCINLSHIFAPGLIDPGTKPWDQSLIERPEDV